MKTIRFHDYGPADVLRLEDVPDPLAGDGQVLVRVAATSVNPIDFKIRSGSLKHRMPIDLPSIPGLDLAGTVVGVGAGVTRWREGERVMGLARATYAELCVVDAATLVAVPDGLTLEDAATLPLVSLTGYQLVHESAKARTGQVILITGALGAVGRSSVFAANEIGCRIIAGVRGRQADEAAALPGVDAVIAIDDAAAIAALDPVDCVADTVGGDVAVQVLARVRDGGIFGTSVRGDYSREGVELNAIFAHVDPETTRAYADAVRDGRVVIPRGPVFPLASAAKAHKIAEAGGAFKIVITI